jgi:PadR family transcriptional regulator, regulatory protein AphA
MELNPTSHVILGMLGIEPMCGYEIKRFVDKSTRFFWAASYGQIYPELGRLSDAGLIEGRPDEDSARGRTEFSLTDAGRAELERWLAEPSAIQEMRDESLLKVFFSSAAGSETTREALDAKRAHHRRLAEELREIESTKPDGDPRSGPSTTLRFGIAFNDFVADWCEREAASR